MADDILNPTFLFRFASPCLFHSPLWGRAGVQLGESHGLPSFGELEGRALFADVRAAWGDEGLAFTVRVAGKKTSTWCRKTRVEASDGFHVWIDTRDTHNIHRATRFCHNFAFLPFGAGNRFTDPCAMMLAINRARELPKPAVSDGLQVRSEERVDGYVLEAFIAASAMTGFDPAEHPKLGFMYAVIDRELGWQTYTMGPEFPITEDPSLWGTLELAGR